MNVSELAKELEVPASVVLEQCLRLGIDAAWAGSDLSAVDVVRLRTELAGEVVVDDEPVESTSPSVPSVPSVPDPDDVEAAAEDASEDGELETVGAASSRADADAGVAGGGGAALPPTAVGSMPDMSDELMESALHGAADPMERRFAGATVLPPEVRAATGQPERPKHLASGFDEKRTDAALRPGFLALALGIALVVAANSVAEPAVIALLWLLGVVSFVVAAVCGNKARYRITTHPDQRRGLIPAIVLLVASVLGVVGMGATIWTTVRSTPADQPLVKSFDPGLGDLSSVQKARWAYLRTRAVADVGWERPAKDVGSCWEAEPKKKPRREERVEVGGAQVPCNQDHAYEVIGSYAVNRTADAPYPGVKSLTATAAARCKAALADLDSRPAGMRVMVEYPTEAGWKGDHDVTCVVYAPGKKPLTGD